MKMKSVARSIALLLPVAAATAFVAPSAQHQVRLQSLTRQQDTSMLRASVEDQDVEDGTAPMARWVELFPNADFLTFELADHRPLGCTVEESLDPNEDYVFVSKVVPEGNAAKAGIQVGDVVVAVTGLFGKATPVLEAGIDKIKGLVGSVPDEDPLVLQVARGTGVFERHESAVVDLCRTSSVNDKEVENCVVDFLASGYDSSGMDDDLEDDVSECVADDDADCMLDGMLGMWADELPLPPTTSGISDQPAGENVAKKPKPWSSRSSPSGTYVRDPVTGEMRNIDA